MFKKAKEIFNDLCDMCDEGIALEEREAQGEDVTEESEILLVRIAVKLAKLQEME